MLKTNKQTNKFSDHSVSSKDPIIISRLLHMPTPDSQIQNLFRSLASCFWDTRKFWDKCTEWPQNDLGHWKVKGTIYTYDNYRWLPNFILFLRYGQSFQIKAILRQVHQMTLNTKRSKVPHIHVATAPDSKFYSVLHYGDPFLSYRPFETNAPNHPKMTKKSKVPPSYTCYGYPWV